MRARRKGFSLIELVVVLFILAIVAGLTVSIVGWLRRAADKGTASNVMGSLMGNIELYRTTYGNYPNRFDSLIESGGTNLYDGDTTTTVDSGLATGLRTGDAKLTTTTLTAGELSSLTKIGITQVMDHVAGSGIEGAPGNSGTSVRTMASGDTVATLGTGTNGTRIMGSVYPTGLPAGVKLVVFGFGPGNESVGKTIASPPAYSGVGDPTKVYDRYLCVFAVYSDGKRAQLKGVLDSTGDFLSQELAEFWDSKAE